MFPKTSYFVHSLCKMGKNLVPIKLGGLMVHDGTPGGFCDITSIKCNSVTSKIFQKCLIIVPKVWEVTHNVFHHPWHIYQMDFYNFFSSSKDFTFDFSMSHCYTRYRSEEISPHISTNTAVAKHKQEHLQQGCITRMVRKAEPAA